MAFQVSTILTVLVNPFRCVLVNVLFTSQTRVMQNLKNIKEPRRKKRRERKMKNRGKNPLHTPLLKAAQPQVLSLKETEVKEQATANIRQRSLQ